MRIQQSAGASPHRQGAVVAQQHARCLSPDVGHQPFALVQVQGDAFVVVIGQHGALMIIACCDSGSRPSSGLPPPRRWSVCEVHDEVERRPHAAWIAEWMVKPAGLMKYGGLLEDVARPGRS